MSVRGVVGPDGEVKGVSIFEMTNGLGRFENYSPYITHEDTIAVPGGLIMKVPKKVLNEEMSIADFLKTNPTVTKFTNGCSRAI